MADIINYFKYMIKQPITKQTELLPPEDSQKMVKIPEELMDRRKKPYYPPLAGVVGENNGEPL